MLISLIHRTNRQSSSNLRMKSFLRSVALNYLACSILVWIVVLICSPSLAPHQWKSSFNQIDKFFILSRVETNWATGARENQNPFKNLFYFSKLLMNEIQFFCSCACVSPRFDRNGLFELINVFFRNSLSPIVWLTVSGASVGMKKWHMRISETGANQSITNARFFMTSWRFNILRLGTCIFFVEWYSIHMNTEHVYFQFLIGITNPRA